MMQLRLQLYVASPQAGGTYTAAAACNLLMTDAMLGCCKPGCHTDRIGSLRCQTYQLPCWLRLLDSL